MANEYENVQNLLLSIASTSDSDINCDDCLALIPELVELHLRGLPTTESLAIVEIHLIHCLCCRDEFELILQAAKTIP